MIENAQNHKTLILSWHFGLLTSVEWLIIYAFCLVFLIFTFWLLRKFQNSEVGFNTTK